MKDSLGKNISCEHGLAYLFESRFPLFSMRQDGSPVVSKGMKMSYFMEIGNEKIVGVEVIINSNQVLFRPRVITKIP